MNDKQISKVYLLSVPLENDYKNTLYFTSKDNQETYFKSKIVHTFSDTSETAYFSYIRKDNVIKVNKHIDSLWNSNYVMYQNPAYNNKWFYSFIKDMKYENDGCTSIEIETDVMQTWAFDYTIKTSFVEREHVNDDTIGKHTLPEGLETGPYKCNKKSNGRSFTSNTIVVGSTIDLGDTDSSLFDGPFEGIAGCMSNGVYNGVRYYSFDGATALNSLLTNVAKKSKSDGIVSVFMGCKDFYDVQEIEGKSYSLVKESNTSKTLSWSQLNGAQPIEKPTKIDNYEPVNKKLLTFPYCYLLASNNNGSDVIYKYEKFSSENCDFQFNGCLTPGMNIRLQPLNYDGQDVNNIEGLNVGKLPICSWSNDVYTNWLTQNSVNIGLGLVSGGITMAAGVGMVGSGAGALMGTEAIVSGGMAIANTLGQIYQHSLTPPQSEGNINNGDVAFASGNSCISMYQMSIKEEYSRVIDEYFSMFGYKVNRVKIPNKAHRSRYWYTKTIDVNIDGAIPMNDMQKIKDCYNRGITFWRNASEIQNYSLSNNIV